MSGAFLQRDELGLEKGCGGEGSDEGVQAVLGGEHAFEGGAMEGEEAGTEAEDAIKMFIDYQFARPALNLS